MKDLATRVIILQQARSPSAVPEIAGAIYAPSANPELAARQCQSREAVERPALTEGQRAVVKKREELARVLEHLQDPAPPGIVRELRKYVAMLEKEIAELLRGLPSHEPIGRMRPSIGGEVPRSSRGGPRVGWAMALETRRRVRPNETARNSKASSR